MRQSDIITIILVASIGVIATFFGVNALLGNPDEAYVKYKNIEPITAELANPDPEFFNSDAINPTVEVFVGGCEDKDQNGIIDQAELEACGGKAEETPEENTPAPAEEETETEQPTDTSDEEF